MRIHSISLALLFLTEKLGLQPIYASEIIIGLEIYTYLYTYSSFKMSAFPGIPCRQLGF